VPRLKSPSLRLLRVLYKQVPRRSMHVLLLKTLRHLRFYAAPHRTLLYHKPSTYHRVHHHYKMHPTSLRPAVYPSHHPTFPKRRATRTRFPACRSDLYASRMIAVLCRTHLNRRCNKGRLLGKGSVAPLRGGAASPKVLIPSMHLRHHLSCAVSHVSRVARALQGQLPTKMDPP